MQYNELAAFLVSASLFHGMNQNEISDMIGCLNPRVSAYEKGATIAHAQTVFDGLGIVLKGEIMVVKESASGHRMVVNHFSSGEMFGEMVSFAPQKLWPVSVSAHTDCTVVFLSLDQVIGICGNQCGTHKQLVKNLMRIMAHKALALNQRLDYLSIRDLKSRIAAYLLDQNALAGGGIFTIALNRDQLADFLNVTRPTLSRVLGKMKEEGLIDFHKAAFKILNYEKLAQL
ncbi:MAG: family transcriptional regulator, dissimilatory nitrate respiration regulator [Clostridiales bacterium]|jgi:CRP-like cAMP-binding protein|nr:family transcriptional regulator, dissimilatory nitrate respiration regulator [Clostridiales bacterium]